jgi:streptogrisin C
MGKRPVIIPTVAIAVVAVAAATATAFADTTDNPSTGSLPAATGAQTLAAPQTLSAMQRDFGLTADQARARVRKERWAQQTDRALKRTLGANYSGGWLNATGDQLTVAVTTAAAADKVRATGAEAKVVARSAGALDAVKARLDRAAARSTAAISGLYVDVSANTVTVVARPGKEAAAGAAVAGSGVARDAVKVITLAEAPKPLFDLRGGDAYFINNQFRCSIGFSVQRGFVTAGHCGAVGDTTAGSNRVAQGTVRNSVFPGNGDFGFVETNNQWTPTATVATSNQGVVPVAGSAEAPVGASICRTGSTTGTRCGVIQAKNATVNYPEGTVTGLTRTNVCAEGGDSGGSWISGDQAQGVTSGGSGNCSVGGTTFFQPVNEILQATGQTLVTTGGNPPPPEDPGDPEDPGTPPPAANCAGHEVSASGSIPAGRAGTTRSFRANAGTHTLCVQRPSGANFEVALQQLTNRGWVTRKAIAGTESVQSMTFDGTAGTFRYRVTARSGSGTVTLGYDIP